MRLALIVAGLAVASAGLAAAPVVSPAQDEPTGPTVTAGIRGHCRVLSVADRKAGCSTVVYQQYATGRVVFLVPLDQGLIAFSGGDDERLSASTYVLRLDAVRMAEGSGEIASHDATGECRVTTTRGPDRFDRIECDAQAEGVGAVRMRFVGDGKRADIRVIAPGSVR